MSEIPAVTDEPFVYVEFDATNATTGPAIKPYKALLVGQRLSTGTVAELLPTRVTSAAQAAEYFGLGSMLHVMAKGWFASNTSTELWVVAQDDDGAAVASQRTLTVTGPATAAGTVFLYIGGELTKIAVASGDTADDVAAAIEAALDLVVDLPFTAASATNVVTLTAKNKGVQANAIDIRFNYNPDEALPAGISIVVAQSVAGTTDPDIDAVWAVLGDEQYDVLGIGYNGSANLSSIDAELSDRWGPIRAIEGVAIVGASDTYANLVTLGSGQNSRFTSIVGAEASPSPPWRWAASVAALVARYGAQDPARPFKSLALAGILPPVLSARFDLLEREALIAEGMATWVVDAGGIVRISRLVTTYKETALGVPDKAFQDVTTPLTLGYMRYSVRAAILSKYPRHKLADDDNEFGAGQSIATPSTIKAEMIALAQGWQSLGLLENLDQFVADLRVERDAQNVSRLNIYLPPDLVNGYLVTAATVAFRL